MTSKRRLSAIYRPSIDANLVAAAEDAVRRGDVASVSSWVNKALERQLEHDRRLAALDEFLAAFELEFGDISDLEIGDATKRTRANAIVVRSQPRVTASRPSSPRSNRRSA